MVYLKIREKRDFMRKRILSILLVLTMCIGLMPISSVAAATALNHVDLQIELPKGGDYFDWSYTPAVTSFTSGSIDLLANGAGFIMTN